MYMRKLGNSQQENEKVKCIPNEMQVEEISAPVLTNTLKGQMHETEQLDLTD